MKHRKVEDKRQHSLTDFLRRALNNLLSTGIFVLVILLLSPLLLLTATPSHSKTSTQNYKPSKPKSTTSNMLRRTQLPAPPTLAEIAPSQVGWPDLSTLRTYYTKPQPKPEHQRQAPNSCLNSKTNSESE